MEIPFYVSPEQMVHDKAEYARQGIAKGKSIVVLEYADGIIFTAENPYSSLNKLSEIYDRIAFAGVGRYSEFENLRKAGIRYADLKGYNLSREDVTTKPLASAYSETIGNIFTRELKPLEVEILVAEVGATGEGNTIYKIQFDGTITDHRDYVVIGGHADRLSQFLKEKYRKNMSLKDALILSEQTLRSLNEENGSKPLGLEVAILDRNRVGRRFRRLDSDDIASLLERT